MNKIVLITITFFSSINTNYDIDQLILLAVKEKNAVLFTKLALSVPQKERDLPAFKAKLKKVGLDETTFNDALKKEKEGLGYTGAATAAPAQPAINEAEINRRAKEIADKELKALKIAVPDIKNEQDAKKALSNFFDVNNENGTGAQLVRAIGKGDDKIEDKVNGIKKLIDEIQIKVAPAA